MINVIFLVSHVQLLPLIVPVATLLIILDIWLLAPDVYARLIITMLMHKVVGNVRQYVEIVVYFLIIVHLVQPVDTYQMGIVYVIMEHGRIYFQHVSPVNIHVQLAKILLLHALAVLLYLIECYLMLVVHAISDILTRIQ